MNHAKREQHIFGGSVDGCAVCKECMSLWVRMGGGVVVRGCLGGIPFSSLRIFVKFSSQRLNHLAVPEFILVSTSTYHLYLDRSSSSSSLSSWRTSWKTFIKYPVLQAFWALTFKRNSKLKSESGLYTPFFITPNVL